MIENLSAGDDYAYAVAIQQDGKIVAAGSFGTVIRYNTNGTRDTSFNGTGKASTPLAPVNAVSIQSDGKIVVSGSLSNGTDKKLGIARLNTDGSIDTTFNTTGSVLTSIGSYADAGTGLAIDANGKIVVAGTIFNADDDGAVARYNPDGTPDTTFNATGLAVTDFGGMDYFYDIAIQSDGKLVTTGSGFISGGTKDVVVARYLP